MANFPNLGSFSLGQKLTSAVATLITLYLSKAVNGDDGSAHDGDVTLGSLTTNRGLEVGEDALVGGGLTVEGAATAEDGFLGPTLDVDIAYADRIQPRNLGTHTVVGTSSANDSVTLDLREYDTFLVKIGSETNAQYQLGNVTLTTAASGTDALLPGSKIRIFFEVNATSASTAAAERRADATWPASMVFANDSDKLLMLDSPLDGALYELTQIGTAGAPKFAVDVTRYRK